jgi:hypothetical protein
MESKCYDWIAFVSMAFSAQDLGFPPAPQVELGEPVEFVNAVGAWSLTICPDFLLCELIVGEDETTAMFTVDLVKPTAAQVLRTMDYLINLARIYVPKAPAESQS